MSGLQVDPVVLLGEHAELVEYPADQIWLRAVGHGDIQVADYRSEDRDGPPAHSHPWDEAQIVVEGEGDNARMFERIGVDPTLHATAILGPAGWLDDVTVGGSATARVRSHEH